MVMGLVMKKQFVYRSPAGFVVIIIIIIIIIFK